MKKIKIKLKNPETSISELLKELEIDLNNIEILVNLEENKETYKKLSVSELIDDWDFISEVCDCDKTADKPCNKPREYEKADSSILDKNDFNRRVVNMFGVTSINELSTFVEAVWVSSLKSPNILFGSELFLTSLKNSYDTVANSCLSIEHELLKMIIENYYGDHTFEVILEDTISKLRFNWNMLPKQSSLAGVAKLLYEVKTTKRD